MSMNQAWYKAKFIPTIFTITGRPHDLYGIWNQWQLDSLFSSLFRIATKLISKPVLLGFWERNQLLDVFLFCWPEQAIEQRVKLLLIRDMAVINCVSEMLGVGWGWVGALRFKTIYELLNLTALNSSHMNNRHIFLCMSKTICVDFFLNNIVIFYMSSFKSVILWYGAVCPGVYNLPSTSGVRIWKWGLLRI